MPHFISWLLFTNFIMSFDVFFWWTWNTVEFINNLPLLWYSSCHQGTHEDCISQQTLVRSLSSYKLWRVLTKIYIENGTLNRFTYMWVSTVVLLHPHTPWILAPSSRSTCVPQNENEACKGTVQGSCDSFRESLNCYNGLVFLLVAWV